jgi:putative FmdB family regulatory protein
MPIYEYRCTSCGFQKEYLKKISDPVMTLCPECDKQTFSKMLTAAGFQLKGSGWYATDFKNSGAKPAAKTDGRDATKSDGRDATKTDGKDTTKTDGKDAATTDGKDAVKSDSKDAVKTESKPDAPVAAPAPLRSAPDSSAEKRGQRG